MREIKFRAWGHFGGYAKDNMIQNWQSSDLIEYVGLDGGGHFEIMQYTGLKDKNGKEIYEGDIVEYDDICSDAHILKTGKKDRGVITWIEKRCQLMPQEIRENVKGGHYIAHWEFLTSIEVIGNIYENPELLKNAG